MYKLLLVLLISIFSLNAKSQTLFGIGVENSFKYKIGGEFELGKQLDNNYVGMDLHSFFTRKRNVPVDLNLKYGYNINQIQIFATTGYYTSGGESIRDKEGVEGLSYGLGASYILKKSHLKISSGITNTNIFISLSIFSNLLE